MVRPIYESSSVISIKMCPIHQAGKELGELGGSAGILL